MNSSHIEKCKNNINICSSVYLHTTNDNNATHTTPANIFQRTTYLFEYANILMYATHTYIYMLWQFLIVLADN